MRLKNKTFLPLYLFLLVFLAGGLFLFPPSATATGSKGDAHTSSAGSFLQTTELPTSTSQPGGPLDRPILVVQSYSSGEDTINPGSDYNLHIRLYNAGKSSAVNVIATFVAGDLIPTGTGGVVAVNDIAPDKRATVSQPVSASYALWGKSITSIDMMLSYSDSSGTTYSEKFTITFPVYTPGIGGPTSTPTATPTSAPVLKPQLVISSYNTDAPVLQPGGKFNLELNVQNMGNADAKRVIMIVGGGSSSNPSSSGTPEPGGTSGSGGEFTNFAPLGSSNVQSLGDLKIGGSLTVRQSLIVNVSANPGAYSMKISFSYLDDKGRVFTDDQVITLLVYSLPQVDVNFYRDPGTFFANQSNILPLQVINLGRKSAILGNMKVTTSNAQLMNNTILVGTLESGGYFPLDASVIPVQAGPLELTITIDYTDDFNQPQKITKTLTLDVMEGQSIEPGLPSGTLTPGGKDGVIGPDGKPISGGTVEPIGTPETFLQKVVRLLRGLVGLDSGISTQTGPYMGPVIPENTQPAPSGRPLKGP